MSDSPMWRPYEVNRPDAFGYDSHKFGVREEYNDGATRYIHTELVPTMEEAETLAARFNVYARKGRKYDNTMKTWQ